MSKVKPKSLRSVNTWEVHGAERDLHKVTPPSFRPGHAKGLLNRPIHAAVAHLPAQLLETSRWPLSSSRRLGELVPLDGSREGLCQWDAELLRGHCPWILLTEPEFPPPPPPQELLTLCLPSPISLPVHRCSHGPDYLLPVTFERPWAAKQGGVLRPPKYQCWLHHR